MSFTSNAKKEQGINNLKQAGRNFKEAGQAATEEFTSELADRAENAGAEVRRYFTDASQRFENAGSDIEQAIHEKPVQSTLIALGVGVLLGMLFRR